MLNVKRQTLTINRQPSTINYISKQRTTNNEQRISIITSTINYSISTNGWFALMLSPSLT